MRYVATKENAVTRSDGILIAGGHLGYFACARDARNATDIANYADREARKECAASLAAVTAERDAALKELDAEQARWQNAIDEIVLAHDPDRDGSGCDSGDPLDLTLCEINGAFNKLADARDAAIERTNVDRYALQQKDNAIEEFQRIVAGLVAERDAIDARCRELEGGIRLALDHSGQSVKHLAALLTPATPAAKPEDAIASMQSTLTPKRRWNPTPPMEGIVSSAQPTAKPETTETPAFKPRRFVSIYNDVCSGCFWQTELDGIGFYEKGVRRSDGIYSLAELTDSDKGFREVPIPDETPAPTCGTCGGTKRANGTRYVHCPDCATAEGGVA